jgi:hypothetical protein
MKKLYSFLTLAGLLTFANFNLQAQSIDTVCVGAVSVPYSVTNTAGSSYAWTLSGGGSLSSATGNATTINWGSTPGRYTLQIQETSSTGCTGDPVSLSVDVIPASTASISGNTNMCYNDPNPTVTISLTGVGPWNFSYSDGTTTSTISNHTSNTFTFVASPTIPTAGSTAVTTTYTMVSVSNKFCSGTVSGSATVVVNPKPVTAAILH